MNAELKNSSCAIHKFVHNVNDFISLNFNSDDVLKKNIILKLIWSIQKIGAVVKSELSLKKSFYKYFSIKILFIYKIKLQLRYLEYRLINQFIREID